MENLAVAVFKEKTSSMIAGAEALVIKNAEGVIKGQAYIQGCRDIDSQIREEFDPICEAANIAHKLSTATRKKFRFYPIEAEKIVNGKISAHMMAVEAENRRIQAEAEAKARKEHDDELRAAQVGIKALIRQTDSLTDQIAKLESFMNDKDTSALKVEATRALIAVLNGKLGNKVEAIQAQETVAEEPSAPVEADLQETKFDGMHMVKTVTVEVVDPKALIAAIVAGTVPVSVIKWDMGRIKTLAKAKVKMPGVKIDETSAPRHSNKQGM